MRASIRAPECLFCAKLTLVIRPRPSKYLTCAGARMRQRKRERRHNICHRRGRLQRSAVLRVSWLSKDQAAKASHLEKPGAKAVGSGARCPDRRRACGETQQARPGSALRHRRAGLDRAHDGRCGSGAMTSVTCTSAGAGPSAPQTSARRYSSVSDCAQCRTCQAPTA